MMVLGVGLLIIAAGVNWLYAVRLSTLNAGYRLPIVTGQYPVRPPARVAALRGIGAGTSGIGALILAQELWSEQPLLGPFLCAVLAVLAIVVPTLVVTVAHNRHLHVPTTRSWGSAGFTDFAAVRSASKIWRRTSFIVPLSSRHYTHLQCS